MTLIEPASPCRSVPFFEAAQYAQTNEANSARLLDGARFNLKSSQITLQHAITSPQNYFVLLLTLVYITQSTTSKRMRTMKLAATL